MDGKKVKYILSYISGSAVMPPLLLLPIFGFTPFLEPGLTEPPGSLGVRREAGAL